MTILNEGASKAMDIVGEQYNSGEAYLPELVLAGDAMTAVMNLLFSKMDKEQAAATRAGTIVIGQAKGDVHDIGKNIVSALLAVNGFEVHDLGIDVPVKKFIETAKEVDADIVLVSTLLTTSLPYLSDTLQYIVDSGYRNKWYYGVGGGPVTPEFTKRLGADGWARTAFDCVEMCRTFMARKTPGQGELILVDSEA
jgi:methanogenic corrinoid protein MtbC1